MKKKIVISSSLFLLLIIWLAPAKLAEGLIPSNRNIEVNGLQGRIWSGQASSLHVDGLSFEDIQFGISFITLLTGQLGGSANIASGDMTGSLYFATDGTNSLSIEEATIETQATLFERFLPYPGISLAGNISSKDFYLDIEDKKPERMSGSTEWNNASITLLNNTFKLGIFQIVWKTDPDNQLITGDIVKTANALSLQGQVILDQKGLLEFKGSISSKTKTSIYNAFLLYSDGKPSNGRLPIKYKKKI